MKSFYKIFFLAVAVFVLIPVSAFAVESNLEGSVSRTHDGTPQYAETVTVNTSLITNNTGTLSFQWTRNGQDITGAVLSSYTLVQNDIGAQIAVKVTSSVEAGTLTSGAIIADKADRTAPAAPTLNTKDKYNITLNVVTGCEYKMQSGSFSASYEFRGLTSYTEYVFYQRYAETAVYKASPASAGISVTTDYFLLNNTPRDISTLNPGDGVLVSGSVTLYGTQSIRVKCSTGAKLTLQNAVIDVSDWAGQCGVEFTGSGQLILAGTNRVYSGSTRAAIETLGSLIISGTGSLYAKGGADGAGIGGGSGQTSGAISITGGIITASGGINAAGIGGGKNGSGSSVNISGGLIYAAGTGADDIGGGLLGSRGTLSISGSSALFLKNNASPSAATSTHTLYYDETVVQSSAYGYSLPDLWTAGITAYAYIDYCTVSFQTNGAGTISSTQAGKMSRINAPTEPVKAGVYFGGWYKDAALTSEFNFSSDRVYDDMTLYARWNVKVNISAGDNGTAIPSGEVYIKQGSDLNIECEPAENYVVEKITSSKGNSYQYLYDHANRLERIIDPLGNEAIYMYDPTGDLIERKLPNTQGGTTTFSYHYDPNGRRIGFKMHL